MWLIASVPRPPSRSSILFCVCNTGSEARRCVSAFWVIMLSLTSFSIQLPPTLSIPHHSSHEATLALQVYMSMYVIWHSIFIMQSQTDIPKCMWPLCTLRVRLSFVLTANMWLTQSFHGIPECGGIVLRIKRVCWLDGTMTHLLIHTWSSPLSSLYETVGKGKNNQSLQLHSSIYWASAQCS